jgi:hypothetical protein
LNPDWSSGFLEERPTPTAKLSKLPKNQHLFFEIPSSDRQRRKGGEVFELKQFSMGMKFFMTFLG